MDRPCDVGLPTIVSQPGHMEVENLPPPPKKKKWDNNRCFSSEVYDTVHRLLSGDVWCVLNASIMNLTWDDNYTYIIV